VKDPSLPLQKAVYDALTAGLAGAAAVYDRIPTDPAGKSTASYPHVHIGEDQIVLERDQCHDPCSAYVTVHVRSRAVGKVEAKAIMANVCEILDVVLAIVGFRVVTIVGIDDGPRHMTDPDGLTSHSVVTFHYRLAVTA
jgi:hypothetical protein